MLPRIDAAPTAPPRQLRLPLAKRDMIAVLLIALSLALPASWVESYYSRGFYPWLQSWLVVCSGWLPFPVMGVVLAGMVVALPAWVWFGWQRRRREGMGVGKVLGQGGLWTLRHGLMAYAAFLLLWGFGYQRQPLPERWGLADVQLSKAELQVFKARILAQVWQDHKASRSTRRAAYAIRAAQRDLVERFEGFRPSLPKKVKSPPAGTLMAMGVTGVVSPWTLEAHVDSALPQAQWLSVYAHELAHLAGFCGEADANLVGYLSGLRSENAFARYACGLMVLRSLGVRSKDLPPRAQRDLKAMRKAQARHRIDSLAKGSSLIYHQYLRSQGVRAGLADYDRGLVWLAKAWKRGLLPRLGRI